MGWEPSSVKFLGLEVDKNKCHMTQANEWIYRRQGHMRTPTQQTIEETLVTSHGKCFAS